MVEQDTRSESNGNDWLANLAFIKIFQGFRAAIQPGKLMLAVSGIVVIFLAGWILDALSPRSARVLGIQGTSELDAYVTGETPLITTDFAYFHNIILQENEKQLRQQLMGKPMNIDAETAEKLIRKGEALSEIKRKYKEYFDKAIGILAIHYQQRCDYTRNQYEASVKVGGDKAEHVQKRDLALEKLEAAYLGLFDALVNDQVGTGQINPWVNQLIGSSPATKDQDRKIDSESDKQLVLDACQLAQAHRLAQSTAGKGIFATFVKFKFRHFHKAVHALVLNRDLATVKTQIYELLKGTCWLVRFHPVYTFILIIIGLAVWAVVGGAICRISALQFARDERIGPLLALKFSLNKFASFFSAPLIPLIIIIFICLAIFLPSLLVAIPVIGEIIGGIVFPLALIGGFIIALVMIGLIGGYNLMYPTIAVEGSDSFDAISRSFSYVFARPWRMGFYTLIAAVYGAVCYLFVRFFAFLLLAAVHGSTKLAVNLDGSSFIAVRGKLDAIWPAPTFGNLHPAIGWIGLNWSESLGGFLIWIWVALVAAAVLAFIVSFFFSINTIIYFLLRRRVDATDLEDVFVEHDVEELVAEEAREEEQTKPEPPTEKIKTDEKAEKPDAGPAAPETEESPSSETDDTAAQDDSNAGKNEQHQESEEDKDKSE